MTTGTGPTWQSDTEAAASSGSADPWAATLSASGAAGWSASAVDELDRDGRYILGPEFARGGMGSSRRGYDRRFCRVIAVKELRHVEPGGQLLAPFGPGFGGAPRLAFDGLADAVPALIPALTRTAHDGPITQIEFSGDGATRLAAGARASVAAGAELRFGRLAPGLVLVDTAAPQLMALRLDDSQVRIGEGGCLALPDADDPQCCIVHAPDGTWLVEQRGAAAPLVDRAVLALADGQPWRIHLPAACPSTWDHDVAALVVANLRLRFAVSRDEEHVELRAFAGERELDLQARAHHYLLLVLARRRLADAREGLPDAAQGWIHHDVLLDMLRIDEGHLNLSIHRARSQLGRLGVADAAALVERRQGTRELRLGARHVEVVPLF